MSEKTTLYFVITKVIAPKNSLFNLVLSVDNSKTILKSPKSRSNAYTIPYKIMKEVSILNDEDPVYNIEIIFNEQNHPTATGSVAIKPKSFLNANSIELKQYDLNVPNMDNVSVFAGVALIPIGEPFLPDFDIYGNSAKVLSKDDYGENQSISEISPTNSPTEKEAEIVESESGKKHRRKKGTTDNECITFISQSGRSHKKHRIYSIPEHSPSFDKKVDDEEIIRSESGSPHRRKRGTKDAKTVTFISEGGHEHRKRRIHQNQQNEINDQNNPNEITDEKQHNEISSQQNEIQNQNQQNEDQNQIQQQRRRRHRNQQSQQQENTEILITQSENGRSHHRKRNSAIDSATENSVSESVIHHKRKKNTESQPEQQIEQQQEQQEQQQQEHRRRRHKKPDSEQKNEDKNENEITENKTEESHRRKRRRKEKSTNVDDEAENSSTAKEDNSLNHHE